jgi:small subunit ribosomal protein S1
MGRADFILTGAGFAVTDQNAGGFGGPKKPKATFGDVMLGIPSGRGGESDKPKGRGGDRDRKGGGGGGRGGDRNGPPRQDSRGPSKEAAAPVEKKAEEKRPGPMVTVRRASGAVETRTMDEAPAAPASSDSVKPEGQGQSNSQTGHAQSQTGHPESSRGATEAVTPAPVMIAAKPSPLLEEHPEPVSFAEMFESSAKSEGGLPGRKHLKVGDKVKAKIFQLGADTAFLTLGGKSEAMIDLAELKDDEGILRLGVGDEVEAHVVETGARGILLSRKLSKGAASISMLMEARNSGMPVEGLVLAVNKGGLEVAIGEVRAFCPSRQVDIRFVEKLDGYVGEKLLFRVTEVKERNVVLSRRSLLEDEQKVKAAELRKTLSVGAVMKGKVVGVQAFGAFVDLGGIEGMIPVSEMSHLRIGHPNEVVKIGDDVEVAVLRMEDAEPNSPDKAKRKERITLSMRQLLADPWTAALEKYKEGVRAKGKVVRIKDFGAFVELEPGIDGLIHISAMSERRIAHPRDAVKVNEEVEVVVEKVDPGEHKIGLRLVKDGQPVGQGVAASEYPQAPANDGAPKAPRAPQARRGTVVTGKVERIESYGIFIGWEGGKGLIPASETGTDRGTDLKRTFPMGTEVKAEVIEVEGNKLKLSIVAAVRSEERADLEAWKNTQKPVGGGKSGLGTLADKFKGLKLS